MAVPVTASSAISTQAKIPTALCRSNQRRRPPFCQFTLTRLIGHHKYSPDSDSSESATPAHDITVFPTSPASSRKWTWCTCESQVGPVRVPRTAPVWGLTENVTPCDPTYDERSGETPIP